MNEAEMLQLPTRGAGKRQSVTFPLHTEGGSEQLEDFK